MLTAHEDGCHAVLSCAPRHALLPSCHALLPPQPPGGSSYSARVEHTRRRPKTKPEREIMPRARLSTSLAVAKHSASTAPVPRARARWSSVAWHASA